MGTSWSRARRPCPDARVSVTPRRKSSAPHAGPTLVLEPIHDGTLRDLTVSARIAPARTLEDARQLARRLGAQASVVPTDRCVGRLPMTGRQAAHTVGITLKGDHMPTRIAINGFGRIGRAVLRAAIERDADYEIVAINDVADAETLAHLLAYDSVYGRFPGTVTVEDGIDLHRRPRDPRPRIAIPRSSRGPSSASTS